MPRRADAGLETALEQRRQTFEQTQQVLAARERSVQEQIDALSTAQARVRMVVLQMDAAQRPVPGVPLPVAVLGDLEMLLDWCEVQVEVERERLTAAQTDADEARGWVTAAHQQVRTL